MNQSPCDIAIVSGFGDKGISDLRQNFAENLRPRSNLVIQSAPWNKAHHDPEKIIREVTDKIDQIPTKDLLLVGHSYGALIALVVACRRQMEGILKLVLLDGPLRSDVKVRPAKLAHAIFLRQYMERERLAKECENILALLPADKSERIITIGTSQDKIVPPEAKKLATNPVNVFIRTEAQAKNYTTIVDGGTNIVIDIPKMAGHGLTKLKAATYGNIIRNML